MKLFSRKRRIFRQDSVSLYISCNLYLFIYPKNSGTYKKEHITQGIIKKAGREVKRQDKVDHPQTLF